MRNSPALTMALPLMLGAAPPPETLPEPGIWTNEEAVYFASERGETKPAWAGLRIDADRRWQRIDEYGRALGEWQSGPIPALKRSQGGWKLDRLEIRQANPFTCWMSVRKFAAKPDGTDDYTYAGKLALFDQGGRVQSGGGASGAPAAVFRLRQVIWPAPSTNKPSLVLYVHRPEEPAKAVSYVWADPDAKLIGMNLRWVQGSCTREGT